MAAVEPAVPVLVVPQVATVLRHARLVAVVVSPVVRHAQLAVRFDARCASADRVTVAVAVSPVVVAVSLVVAVSAVAAQRDVLHVAPDREPDRVLFVRHAVHVAAEPVLAEPVPAVPASLAVAHLDRVRDHHAPGTSGPSRDRARCLRASASRGQDGMMVLPE